jgi:hypothetical protein
MTVHSPINRLPKPGLRPRQWSPVDSQSTALGTVGNVSVELGLREYRVVLNCRNTDDAFQSDIHGSPVGTSTENQIPLEEVTS